MKVYDWEQKLIIDTPFPHDAYDSYLFEADVDDSDNPTIDQIEEVFLLARDDFRIGRLGFDELSDVCNMLFGLLTKNPSHDPSGDLYYALLAGGELTFYARTDEEQGLRQLIYFLKDIQNYKRKS